MSPPPAPNFAFALASDRAIPIQANPALANGAAIKTSSAGGLVFDDGAGHYRAVTGRVFGNARYTQTGVAGTQAFLTLLTLDVMSNRPNNQVFVDLGSSAATRVRSAMRTSCQLPRISSVGKR